MLHPLQGTVEYGNTVNCKVKEKTLFFEVNGISENYVMTMSHHSLLRNGKNGQSKGLISQQDHQVIRTYEYGAKHTFQFSCQSRLRKITSLVMTNYAMNYVISEKSKHRQRCYILEKKQNTQSWFSGWYSKKMISHDVMKQYDVNMVTLYDVIIGSLFTDYMAITSKFINSIFDQSNNQSQ